MPKFFISDVDLTDASLTIRKTYTSVAIAGGQPMETQPRIELLDDGNNRLLLDYSTQVVAKMISSPSVTSSLSVSTADATNTTASTTTNKNFNN